MSGSADHQQSDDDKTLIKNYILNTNATIDSLNHLNLEKETMLRLSKVRTKMQAFLRQKCDLNHENIEQKYNQHGEVIWSLSFKKSLGEQVWAIFLDKYTNLKLRKAIHVWLCRILGNKLDYYANNMFRQEQALGFLEEQESIIQIKDNGITHELPKERVIEEFKNIYTCIEKSKKRRREDQCLGDSCCLGLMCGLVFTT